MVMIKFLKETELRKIGDVVSSSKASAENYVSHGYAEYVNGDLMDDTIISMVSKSDNHVPTNIKISEAVKQIRTGRYKRYIDYLRQETDKKKRTNYKTNNLPAYIFGGKFSYVTKDGSRKIKDKKGVVVNILPGEVNPSGLLCLDIDQYADIEANKKLRAEFSNNKHVVMAFLSPSGGLKVVIRIPIVTNDEEYKTYYFASLEHFKGKYDRSTCDISRLCYVSYDPDIYYNPDAEPFTQQKEIENKETILQVDILQPDKQHINKEIPSHCPFIEEIACKHELPSGGKTKHGNLDGNVFQYSRFNNKPKILTRYKKAQGRQDPAFNDSEKWAFNCGSIIVYWKDPENIKNKYVQEGAELCKACPLNKKCGGEYTEKKIIIDGFIHIKKEEIGSRGGVKTVIEPQKTTVEINIRLYKNKFEFYHNEILVNVYKIKGNPTNKEINSMSRVLLDINAFDKIKDARCWIFEKELFNEIIGLKKELTEISNIEAKRKKNLPVESLNLTWNFNLAIQNIEDHARQILNKNPLYYSDDDKWFRWDFNLKKWKEIPEHYIFEFIKKMYDAQGLSKNTNRKDLLNALMDETVTRKPRDLENTQIQFATKIYNIKDGSFIESTPKHFCKLYIPHELDKNLKCPTLDKILKQWCPNDTYKLYEIIAYIMSPVCFLDILFWFVGAGNNGKGLYYQVIINIISLLNVSTQDLGLLTDPKDRFTKGFLKNKLLCYLGDENFNSLKNTKALKTLSGNKDTLRIEIKGGGQTDEINTSKVIGQFNTLPETLDKTKGFYRRNYVTEFKEDFTGGKNPLPNVPKEEYTALATKCFWLLVRQYKDQNIKGFGTFEERKANWERLSNPISQFKQDFMFNEPKSVFILSQFVTKYQQFAYKNGFNEYDYYSIKDKLAQNGLKTIKKVVYTTDDGYCFGTLKSIPKRYTICSDDDCCIVDKSMCENPEHKRYDKTDNKITVYVGYQFKDYVGNGTNGTNIPPNGNSSSCVGKSKPKKVEKSTICTIDNLAWDERVLIWKQCQFEGCNKTPCNESSDHKFYCRAHYEGMK